MQPRPQTWDVRANALKGETRVGLSLLVEAVTKPEAERHARTTIECDEAGYRDVRIEWAIVYPPKQRPRAQQAITD